MLRLTKLAIDLYIKHSHISLCPIIKLKLVYNTCRYACWINNLISKLGVPDTFLEKHSSPQQIEQKHNLNVFLTRKTTGKDIQMSNNNNYLMMERIINNKYTFISVETLTTGRMLSSCISSLPKVVSTCRW